MVPFKNEFHNYLMIFDKSMNSTIKSILGRVFSASLGIGRLELIRLSRRNLELIQYACVTLLCSKNFLLTTYIWNAKSERRPSIDLATLRFPIPVTPTNWKSNHENDLIIDNHFIRWIFTFFTYQNSCLAFVGKLCKPRNHVFIFERSGCHLEFEFRAQFFGAMTGNKLLCASAMWINWASGYSIWWLWRSWRKEGLRKSSCSMKTLGGLMFEFPFNPSLCH